MKIKFFFLFLIGLTCLSVKAQFVDFGQDPAGLRWKQIKTKDFQIIYPDFFEENAQKMANLYAALYAHSNTLDHKPVKVSVIVHPNGGISNGSVAWAPRRSDLYTMPQQEISDPWLEHLCVHEFRHVVQIDKVNQGLTKILYYIFGEQITIAITGIYLPQWFMEGDAVTFETALGHLGRGRSPEFINKMKAQIVEKGLYSYYKAALGSYKDYVPNQYIMGYFMVGNSRINYGPSIWSNALNRIGKHPLSFAPFTTSLKRTLRQGRDRLWQDSTFRSLFIHPDSVKKANTYRDAKRTLYHDNFSQLRQIWKKETDRLANKFDTIATRNEAYTNYTYPLSAGTNKIITYKEGLQQTGAFVLIEGKRETLLTRTGNTSDPKFILADNRLIWTEYRPHLRWEHGGRMSLVSYDLQRRKYRYHRSGYNRFSPFSIGKNIGIVEVDNQNQASIVILDQNLKQEIRRIKASPNELFVHPSAYGDTILTTVQSPRGIFLEIIDSKTGTRKQISKPVWYEIDHPFYYNDSTIIYRASFNGNNSLYAKNLHTGSDTEILTAQFGLRFPSLSPDKDSLYFAFYTSDGYKPGKFALSPMQPQNFRPFRFSLADSLAALEKWKLDFETDSLFPSKKYSKFTHLLNIHSWGPLYINRVAGEANLGIVAYSQNKLSTFFLAGGFIKDSDYDHGAWMLNATYKGIWPVFSLDFKTGKYNYYTFNTHAFQTQTGKYDTLYLYNKSNYTQGSFTVQFPFNLSVKNYYRYITPYARYKIEAIHNNHSKKGYRYTFYDDIAYLHPVSLHSYRLSTSPNYYQMLEYGLIFQNQTRMTVQEINPRWGQILQGGYAHTPLQKMDLGQEWWVAGSFYFPGLFRNHSLYAYSGFQRRPKDNFYDKKILAPRGIKIYGYEFTTVRSGYKLPLFYPDQHITSLIYVKAVNGGIFFDMAHEKNVWETCNYYSYGAEFTADIHLFRLPFPIDVGFRLGYETQKHKMFADFLFNINFSI